MNALFWGVLCLLLCAPGLKVAPRVVGTAALLYALYELAIMLPMWWWNVFGFGLQYNWTGKLFSTLPCLVAIYGLRWVSSQEVGLARPVPGSLRIVVPVVLAYALLEFASGYDARHHLPRPTLEALFYELTMPGLAEELFSRGVLLGLLSRVFPRTLPFLGARTSWGGVVSVGLFVLSHIFSFPGLLMLPKVHLTLGLVYGVGISGTLYLWVRERTGSCWAAILMHNLGNFCLYAGRSTL